MAILVFNELSIWVLEKPETTNPEQGLVDKKKIKATETSEFLAPTGAQEMLMFVWFKLV